VLDDYQCFYSDYKYSTGGKTNKYLFPCEYTYNVLFRHSNGHGRGINGDDDGDGFGDGLYSNVYMDIFVGDCYRWRD
jgi:hypothetical protein